MHDLKWTMRPCGYVPLDLVKKDFKEKGDVCSAFLLGLYFFHGHYTPKNKALAYRIWLKGARLYRQLDSPSERETLFYADIVCHLGIAIIEGCDARFQPGWREARAIRLFRKSAKLGLSESARVVGAYEGRYRFRSLPRHFVKHLRAPLREESALHWLKRQMIIRADMFLWRIRRRPSLIKIERRILRRSATPGLA
jgi:TPR repeat protein